MADPVEVIRSLMTGNTAVAAIIGARAFRADAVTANTTRPFTQLTLVADEPDYDLDGTVDDSTATVNVESVVDSTTVGAAALVALVPAIRAALTGAAGTLVNGVTVYSLVTTDSGDEPNGPADSQGRTAFMRLLTVQITYS